MVYLLFKDVYSVSCDCFLFVIQVFGCAVLAAGIWMKFEVHKFIDVNPSNPVASHIAIFFMSVGIAIALVGLMSCYCTLSGNPILLYLVSINPK